MSSEKTLNKIEDVLNHINDVREFVTKYYAEELILAAEIVETMKTLENLENQMKQLRGMVMEDVVI